MLYVADEAEKQALLGEPEQFFTTPADDITDALRVLTPPTRQPWPVIDWQAKGQLLDKVVYLRELGHRHHHIRCLYVLRLRAVLSFPPGPG